MSGVIGLGRLLLLAAGDNPVHDVSIFAPASSAAESIVSLSILVFAVCGLIFLVVEGVLIYSMVRFRRGRAEKDAEP